MDNHHLRSPRTFTMASSVDRRQQYRPAIGNTMWVQDESSREWKLVPVATATAETYTADGDLDVVHPANTDTEATATLVSSSDVCDAIVVAVEPTTTPINPNKTTAGIQYHEVLSTDTFQGICLRYKVVPTELRRANKMLGSNLKLAPERLIIPANDKNWQLKFHSSPRGLPTKEEQIASLFSRVSRSTRNGLSYSEARAYLEIADWDVNCAVKSADEDFGWFSKQT